MKNTTKRVIGTLMIATPVMSVPAALVYQAGWPTGLYILLFTSGIALYGIVAVYLLLASTYEAR